MQKKIKISLYIDTLEKFQGIMDKYQFIHTSIESYDAIVINGKIYGSDTLLNDIDTEREVKVLVNDDELEGMHMAMTDSFMVDVDMKSHAEMPEYETTIDNNLLVVQLNMNMGTFDEIMKEQLWYWDENRNFCCNRPIDYHTMLKHIDRVREYGYYAPVVIYCDHKIQPIHYDHFYYIYKFLGFKRIPIRVVCYKDVRYLLNLDRNLYLALSSKGVDDVDLSEHFVTNYSDKRKILSNFVQSEDFPPVIERKKYPIQSRPLKIDNWYPIFYFLFDSTYSGLNAKLAYSILGSDSVRVRLGDFLYENVAMINHACAYLKGYERYVDISTEEKNARSEIDLDHMEKYEVYRESDVLDPSFLPLIWAHYNQDKQELHDKICKAFNADIIIYGDDMGAVLGMDRVHELLLKDKVRVKWVRPVD